MIGLTRRRFVLGSVVAGFLGTQATAQSATATVKLPDGTYVPAIGQGSWHLAQGRYSTSQEEEALRTGISLGLSVIDTAEIYSGGRSEEMIGRVIAGQRDKVFLVSKVAPEHAGTSLFHGNMIRYACNASLDRLQTDYLDLYLLHTRGGVSDLSFVVDSFEGLLIDKKIRRWGVSSFTVKDMEDLFRVPGGNGCAINEAFYNLENRGIENDVLPWFEQHGLPLMAYSPLNTGRGGLLQNLSLIEVAARHQASPAAIALAWTIRSGRVIAVVESGSPDHVRQNALALTLKLTDQDLADLDQGFR